MQGYQWEIILFCNWCAMLLCESWIDVLMCSFSKPAENFSGMRKAGDALCRSYHIGCVRQGDRLA
jgi:hypothetical protein